MKIRVSRDIIVVQYEIIVDLNREMQRNKNAVSDKEIKLNLKILYL